MTKTVAQYNAQRAFSIEFRESRLKKCAVLLGRLDPGHMLDAGCADGAWMAYWQSRGWRVSGMDINPNAVAQAKVKGLEAKVCDLTREPAPYGDETFELVFAGEVIEHLVDTDSFLQELQRVLKPGGRLLLTTPNLASFENRLRLLLGRYPRWLDYNLSNCGHVRAYTPAILKRQLQAHGLRVIRHTGNWIPFLPQAWIDDIKAPWLAFTGGLWPNWAMDIIMLAEKAR
jgi:2-polyprenyl-3-methyl-5-hydroxy-6-metoxy-1,4-benzoquinol methylase